MSEPDDLYNTDGDFHEVVAWEQPALILRVTYNDGLVDCVSTEYRDKPSPEELARVVAQFITIRPGSMPGRVPGMSVPRDPALERQFQAVVDQQCMSVWAGPGGNGGHDVHTCQQKGWHRYHHCVCGASQGE